MIDYTRIAGDFANAKIDFPKFRAVTEDEIRSVAMKVSATGYVVTPPSVEAIEKYIQGRSLWLMGRPGTGKSVLFKALSEIRSVSGEKTRFAVVPMANLDGISLNTLREFLVAHEDDELVVDDIGSEAQTVEFGKTTWALNMILSMRDYSKARTHFTGNISEETVRQRYGARTLDRLRLCSQVMFLEDTRRTSSAPQTIVKAKSDTYVVLTGGCGGRADASQDRIRDIESDALDRDMMSTRPWD